MRENFIVKWEKTSYVSSALQHKIFIYFVGFFIIAIPQNLFWTIFSIASGYLLSSFFIFFVLTKLFVSLTRTGLQTQPSIKYLVPSNWNLKDFNVIFQLFLQLLLTNNFTITHNNKSIAGLSMWEPATAKYFSYLIPLSI